MAQNCLKTSRMTLIFRTSCVASYLLAMVTTVSWVHCGATRHRKLSKAGDGGDGDGKKKHCGAQHVSGTYTNCYACFMMFGFIPTTIVPGCTQMVRGPPGIVSVLFLLAFLHCTCIILSLFFACCSTFVWNRIH